MAGLAELLVDGLTGSKVGSSASEELASLFPEATCVRLSLKLEEDILVATSNLLVAENTVLSLLTVSKSAAGTTLAEASNGEAVVTFERPILELAPAQGMPDLTEAFSDSDCMAVFCCPVSLHACCAQELQASGFARRTQDVVVGTLSISSRVELCSNDLASRLTDLASKVAPLLNNSPKVAHFAKTIRMYFLFGLGLFPQPERKSSQSSCHQESFSRDAPDADAACIKVASAKTGDEGKKHCGGHVPKAGKLPAYVQEMTKPDLVIPPRPQASLSSCSDAAADAKKDPPAAFQGRQNILLGKSAELVTVRMHPVTMAFSSTSLEKRFVTWHGQQQILRDSLTCGLLWVIEIALATNPTLGHAYRDINRVMVVPPLLLFYTIMITAFRARYLRNRELMLMLCSVVVYIASIVMLGRAWAPDLHFAVWVLWVQAFPLKPLFFKVRFKILLPCHLLIFTGAAIFSPHLICFPPYFRWLGGSFVLGLLVQTCLAVLAPLALVRHLEGGSRRIFLNRQGIMLES